jgi:gliding motility-associated-like protein
MKNTLSNIILACLLFLSCDLLSQTNCTVPLAPVLTSVSVQSETGKTDFTWAPSPSTGIAAYIIYSYKNGDGMPVDTVWDPSARSWTISTNANKYLSISYVVTAHRLSAVAGLPGCTSPLSNAISTIYCTPALDTCNNKITLSWNKYSDYPKKVTGYKIFVSENGGPAVEKYSADKSAQSFVITDFRTNYEYCYSIKAVLEDGTFSGSNKACISTTMKRPPEWINADYATINSQGKTELSFSIDPLSGLNQFILEKREGSIQGFSEVARLASQNGKVLYTDNKSDPSKASQYRLSALNNCGVPVTSSGTISSMVLLLKHQDEDIMLFWNSLFLQAGVSVSYNIFADIGNGFKNQATTSDTTFTLKIRNLMYDITGKEVCFFIEARENNNPHGLTGTSNSSRACLSPSENVTVPNVFTPNNDLRNDKFKPVLSFTPSAYHLMISDRKGRVLFESNDYLEEWDGSNGSNQDVCLWFLKIRTPSGKDITKTGTVTIIK